MKKENLWPFLFWPTVFLAICWAIWLYDYNYPILHKWGVRPRKLEGLIGIITSPFLHKDLNHLAGNSAPTLVLGTTLFYFYRNLPYKVIFWLFLGGGSWLWVFGGSGNHIGASGLIYGLFSFVFLGGIISKNKSLMAISLLTVFLYGSLIWGIFPLEKQVSWEGHLMSMVWGIILALFYKKYIPRSAVHPLTNDDSKNEFLYGEDYWKTEDQLDTETLDKSTKITYFYKEKDPVK